MRQRSDGRRPLRRERVEGARRGRAGRDEGTGSGPNRREKDSVRMDELYISAACLESTGDPSSVLRAVREIVINFVGSEDFEILRNDGAASALARVYAMPATAERGRWRAAEPLIRRTIETGRRYVAGADGGARAGGGVVACVPLLESGRVAGVLVIYGMLPQKPALTALDRALLDLLSTRGVAALGVVGSEAVRDDPGRMSGS